MMLSAETNLFVHGIIHLPPVISHPDGIFMMDLPIPPADRTFFMHNAEVKVSSNIVRPLQGIVGKWDAVLQGKLQQRIDKFPGHSHRAVG